MISVKFDTSNFSKITRNAMNYSSGFFQGVEMNRTKFNQQLGELAVEMLKKYIDSRARSDRSSLHHVYEWDMSGSPDARLFELESKASATNIIILGNFLPSKSISDTSSEPFVDKANVMENSILVEITPKNNVLAFEADGETVFTTDSIYIANPGGDEVAGSFGKTVEDFFDSHFTAQVLMQSGLYQKLSSASEYAQFFASGANGGGSAVGIQAGKKYLTVKGVEFS
jgi:hypothetical protein